MTWRVMSGRPYPVGPSSGGKRRKAPIPPGPGAAAGAAAGGASGGKRPSQPKLPIPPKPAPGAVVAGDSPSQSALASAFDNMFGGGALHSFPDRLLGGSSLVVLRYSLAASASLADPLVPFPAST